MEFDEVYEEIRGVLVSLVVLSIEILNDHWFDFLYRIPVD